MEWVEVAGKTVEEATEQALDQLGVAADDAEVIVLAEPKTGLFGRVRVEARVRARVRPVGVRPKRERGRDRDSGRSGRTRQGGRGGQGQGQRTATKTRPAETSSGASGGGGSAEGTNNGASGGRTGSPGSGTSRSARRRRNRSQSATAAAGAGGAGAERDEDGNARNGSGSPASAAGRPVRNASHGSSEAKETEDMAEGMTLEEQGEIGREFLSGLLAEYGMTASVETRLLDEDTVEIAATGEDLGILVGPRGSTLAALQDLTRAVVQRQCPSRTDRILVDVAGYREKRSAALKRFSTQIAQEVLASGQEKALEAMSPADRKSVHDAINELDGVVTRSEGEDPNRYIVIAPAG
ncbi:MAG TPA: RNA-binding cell elongation regulator Jag/EloR [Acidimicrobiales bacterium]